MDDRRAGFLDFGGIVKDRHQIEENFEGLIVLYLRYRYLQAIIIPDRKRLGTTLNQTIALRSYKTKQTNSIDPNKTENETENIS